MKEKRLEFAVPPGQHILDELEARGMTFDELRALAPGIGTEAALVTGDTQITAPLAEEIGAALEMPAKIWLDLERRYRDSLTQGAPNLSATNVEAAQMAASSGRLLLRLPASLHQRAALAAKTEGVSLNQLLLSYIAEGLGRSDAGHR